MYWSDTGPAGTPSDKTSRARSLNSVRSLAMKNLVTRFAQDQSGATAIEYGLIATLISVAIIVGAGALGTKLNSVFNGLSTKLTAP